MSEKCMFVVANYTIGSAYHFVGDKLRDGSPVPPDGEWLIHSGPLKMCESGLHASLDPFDALAYAPGPILCMVKVGGTIIQGDDKLVASERMIVARRDFEPQLREFACWCALSVVHLWNPPEIVTRYLTTRDPSLREASLKAAKDAARAAARAAAQAAAWAAAWAARDAAREAAVWAAGAAARQTQRKFFNDLVMKAFSEEEQK